MGSFFYIDDTLLHNQSDRICYENTLMLRDLLHSSGFLVNTEKSVFISTQRILFLEKIHKIINAAVKIYNTDLAKIRDISSLIGLFTSASSAVLLAPTFH